MDIEFFDDTMPPVDIDAEIVAVANELKHAGEMERLEAFLSELDV